MESNNLHFKLSFVPGLQGVVLDEIDKIPKLVVTNKDRDSIFVDFLSDFSLLKKLRSVARVYLIANDSRYNPTYISKHKSVLGDIVQLVLDNSAKKTFSTYKISCAGSDSPEVKEINRYIKDTFDLEKADEADLKIHIIKNDDELWEVGVQITPRPLSLREYKVRNMSGAMDPTIAYAMNSLCGLENAKSYLNIFSGSGTLLIESARLYGNLEKLIGFDIDKEHLSLSIQNIKAAGLIERVQVKEAEIFDNPDFGKFDVIVSDLPFGMVISKNEDLEKLYKTFVEYAETHLNTGGTLAVYTSEFETFEKVVNSSVFKIVETLDIKLMTAEDYHISTRIIVLKVD